MVGREPHGDLLGCHAAKHTKPVFDLVCVADPQPVLEELSGAFGPVVGLGSGPVRMAIVGDPTALRKLFGTSTDAFRWGHRFNVLGFVVGAEPRWS